MSEQPLTDAEITKLNHLVDAAREHPALAGDSYALQILPRLLVEREEMVGKIERLQELVDILGKPFDLNVLTAELRKAGEAKRTRLGLGMNPLTELEEDGETALESKVFGIHEPKAAEAEKTNYESDLEIRATCRSLGLRPGPMP